MEDLKTAVRDAFNSAKEGNSQKSGTCIAYIEDIRNVINSTISTSELSLTRPIVLDPVNGLLQTACHALANNMEVDCNQALEFIKMYIEKLELEVALSADHLQTYLLRVIIKGTKSTSKVKAAEALMPLIALSNDLNRDAKVRELFDKLFQHFKPFKASEPKTVVSSIAELLGVVIHYFPKEVDARVVSELLQLLKWHLDQNDAKDSSILLAGIFGSLSHILFSFPDLVTNKFKNEIWTLVDAELNKPRKSHERQANLRSALDLLSNHASIFSDAACKELVNERHEVLDRKKKAGALLEQVKGVLDSVEDFDVKHSHVEEKLFSKCVQALGTLLPVLIAFKFRTIESITSGIFQDIAKVAKRTLTTTDEPAANILIPGLLTGFATGYRTLQGAIPDKEQNIELMNAVVSLVLHNYPRAHEIYKQSMSISLLGFLWALYEKDELRSFWASKAYDLVVLTCSDPTSSDSITLNAPESGRSLYLRLWSALFKGGNVPFQVDRKPHEGDEDYGIRSKEINGTFYELLFDEVMNVILRIPEQLDLSLLKSDEEGGEGSAEVPESDTVEHQIDASDLSHLQAVNQKDYCILVNLVDFTDLLLQNVGSTLFEKWMYVAAESWIAMSRKQHSLVSGFHRLFGLCLRMAKKSNFFNNILKDGLDGEPHNGTEEELRNEVSISQRKCYILFTRHIQDLLVEMQTFKDELLASCLRVVLEAPRELTSVIDFARPLRVSLRFGLTYHPFAELAMDVLESWVDTMPNSVMQPIYKDLLPSLNDYLTSDAIDIQLDADIVDRKGKTKHLDKKKKQRIAAKFIEKADANSAAVFKTLRIRAVRLLGKTGRDAILMMGDRIDTYKKALRWERDQKLNFDLPYPDVKLPIVFDDILPRILELAEVSSDRKTKMAACELIHSLVTLMVGKTDAKADRGQFTVLWSKVFPVMLILSVDVDTTVRELIRPFTLQIIRWLTKYKTSDRPETESILSACFDALASSDGQRRDFAASALETFFEWSIKHTTRAGDDIVNAQTLIARMHDFSKDSNLAKRLGSAMLFNRIHRLFASEQNNSGDHKLVDTYGFELLYYLLQSLRMCDSDPNGEASSRPVIEAIGHMKNIILKYLHVLSETRDEPEVRRSLPTLDGSTNLATVVEWLFRQAGNPEMIYAQHCVMLWRKLVPALSRGGASDWLTAQVNQQRSYLTNIFEPVSIRMPSEQDTRHRDSVAASMRQLISALSGYSFLMVNNLRRPTDILKIPGSVLLVAIVDFLKYAAKVTADDTDEILLRSIDRERARTLRATGVMKVFTFIAELMKSNDRDIVPGIGNVIDNQDFQNLVTYAIFDPSRIGLNPESTQVRDGLPRLLHDLLTVLRRVEPVYNPLIEKFQSQYQSRQGSMIESLDFAFACAILLGSQSLEAVVEPTTFTEWCRDVLDAIAVEWNDEQHVGDYMFFKGLEGWLDIVLNDQVTLKLYCSQFLGFKRQRDFDSVSFKFKFRSFIYQHMVQNWGAKYHDILATYMDNEQLPILISELLEFALEKKEVLAPHLLQLCIHSNLFKVMLEGPQADNSSRLRKILEDLIALHVAINGRDDRQQHKMSTILDFLNTKGVKMLEYVFNDRLVFASNLVGPLLFLKEHNPEMDASLQKFWTPMTFTNDEGLRSRVQKVAHNFLDAFAGTPRPSIMKTLWFLLGSYTSQGYEYVESHDYSRRLIAVVTTIAKTAASDEIILALADTVFAALEVAFNKEDEMNALMNYIIKNAVRQYLIPILQTASVDIVRSIYTKHIKLIIRFFGEEEERRPIVESTRLTRAICCFNLLQISAERLNNIDLNDGGSVVMAASDGTEPMDTRKKLFGKKLIPKALEARGAKGTHNIGNDKLEPQRLEYRQAAYAWVCAFIVLTQKRAEVYLSFLFEKNNFKWEDIIDAKEPPSKDKLNLKAELKAPFVRKRIAELYETPISSSPTQGSWNRSRYLSTQFLLGSSLNVSQPGVPTSTLKSIRASQVSRSQLASSQAAASQAASQAAASQAASSPKLKSQAASQGVQFVDGTSSEDQAIEEDEIDFDIFNQHPCMRGLIAAMQKLHQEALTLSAKADFSQSPSQPASDRMPDWMAKLLTSLKGSHLYIQLFIGKLVINLPRVFQPFSKYWWGPLVELVTRADEFGEGFNYYIQDICLTLMSWMPMDTDPDTRNKADALLREEWQKVEVLFHHLLTNFMEQLVKISPSDRSTDLRNTVRIIERLSDFFRGSFDPPLNALSDLFMHKPEPKLPTAAKTQAEPVLKKTRIAGVFLLCAFAVNCGKAFLDHDDFPRVFTALMSVSNNEDRTKGYTSHLTAVAECAGKILALSEKNGKYFKTIYDETRAQVADQREDTKHPEDAVYFLYGVTRSFPGICDRKDTVWMMSIKRYNSFVPEVRAKVLEVISCTADKIEHLFEELKGFDLLAILRRADNECQLWALTVLMVAFKRTDPPPTMLQIKFYLEDIVSIFPSHPSERCRLSYYSLIMKLRDIFADKIDEEPKELCRFLTSVLMRGLADPYEVVKTLIAQTFNTWLPTETVPRLNAIFSYYSSATEDVFLSFASHLLLMPIKTTPDFTTKVFTDGLDDANFVVRKRRSIDTRWTSSVMKPLFASQEGDHRDNMDVDERRNLIRATNASLVESMSLQQNTPLQIRNFFSVDPTINPTLNSGSARLSSTSYSQISRARDLMSPLRKRTFASTNAGTDFFARIQVRKNKAIDQALQQQREARRTEVSLVREYRIGELPDIQISQQEVIEPLMVLVQRDTDTCQIVLPALATGVLKKLSKNPEAGNFPGIFDKVMEQSPGAVFPFANSMLRVAQSLKPESIKTDRISQLSNASSNQISGVMIIENVLYSIQNSSSNHKRNADEDTPREAVTASMWKQLADLYKSLDYQDIQNAVYESFLTDMPALKFGAAKEAEHDYDAALKIYQEARDGAETAETALKMGNLMLEVMQKLGHWESWIVSIVHVETPDDPNSHVDLEALFNAETAESTLRRFVKSVLRQEKYPSLLKTFVDEVQSDDAKIRVVRQVCPYEWSVSLLKAGYHDQFRQAVVELYSNFVATFQTVNPLSWEVRAKVLSHLPHIVDLDEYENQTRNLPQKLKNGKLEAYLTHLNDRLPSTSDALEIWDDLITSRLVCLQDLTARLDNLMLTDEVDTIPELIKDKMDECRLTFGHVARLNHRGNWATSNLKTVVRGDRKLAAMAHYESAEYYWGLTVMGQEDRDHSIPYADLYGRICSDMLGASLAPETGGQCIQNLLGSYGFSVLFPGAHSQDGVINALIKSSYTALVGSDEKMPTDAKELLRVAEFCNRILQQENLDPDAVKMEKYAAVLTESVMRVMAKGDNSLSHFLPLALRLAEKYPTVRETFSRFASEPPSWVYLRWLPQLSALMDHELLASVVFPVLDAVANDYPSAAIHSLTISGQQLFSYKADNYPNKVKFDQIKAKAQSQTMKTFVVELKRLGEPYVLLSDWKNHVKTILSSKDFNKGSAAKLAIAEIREVLLEGGGDRVQAFARLIRNDVEALIGKGATGRAKGDIPLLKMTEKEFEKKMNELLTNKKVEALSPKNSEYAFSKRLADYSKWMANYPGSDNSSVKLEIPGQYDTNRRPYPWNHSFIQSFKPEVSVMSSLRKPKRLDMIGSDEKVHMWLVKGGEDIRVDQRIQQMFGLMNDIMSKDPHCARDRLHLTTYKVIPMTQNLGIIEWVSNSMPLAVCLNTNAEYVNDYHKSNTAYTKSLPRALQKDTVKDIYERHAKKSRDEVVNSFVAISKMIRKPYLRIFLQELCLTPEAFILLRNEFANSLAALNICMYLLGIGDRHLENYLVDLKSGRLVAIDFGHAFGSATEFLPVPELIPFRHTTVFEEVLSPLGSQGLLHTPMTRVMTAMRDSKEILLNAMDIFVKEPLLEWQERARVGSVKQKKGEEYGEDKDPAVWFPKKKLDIARQKLEGVNPAVVMSQELPASQKQWETTLKGDPGWNIRARVGRKCTTVREQVLCLMDQASDPHIKGKMWSGWSSWI
ncbi:hypothetical protein SmJEL517_g00919 [Synchytrium microbalum]|uniref:DNA-dependent protein kinase catalytic subunit n=1 Tax=Synchytrium microbalum TaxID=1806994 RepID=A0A507CG18_9FUNG|nr:uncharacterized protein SmJEL517_g00919 [Synchytrium microbalum]TPX36936.1 hypothetical protein SmJEL517_g00919 [Synchytrium microbalum]